MESIHWLAFGLVALGTFLMRLGPLYWMRRRLKKLTRDPVAQLPPWLKVLGLTMIAAMLGASLTPSTHSQTLSLIPSLIHWLAVLLGSLTTLLVWHKKQAASTSVLTGIAVFAIITSLNPGL